MTHNQAHELLVLITYATSEDTVEPAHLHRLYRAFATCVHKVKTLTKAQPNCISLALLDTPEWVLIGGFRKQVTDNY